MVTPALAVFERIISGALKNGVIDEEQFNTIQTLHLGTLNELTGIDCRMEAENRSLVEKSLMEEINELKKKAETKAYLLAHCVISYITLKMDKIYYQPNHLWKGQKNLVGRNLEQLNNDYLDKHFEKYVYQLLRASIDLIMK